MGRAAFRDVLAVVTLWVPFVIVVVTWLMWRDSLPAELPTQWNRDGVSSTLPTWLMIGIASLTSLAAAVGATFALPTNAAPNRRRIFLGAGFAAGFVSSIWVGIGAATISANGTSEPEIGAWPLLTIVSCAYGLIPFFLAHKWTDEDFEEEHLAGELL